MGALPRPDLPPGPHLDLVTALHDLHHRAGWPSLRRLAVAAGCSHTTVSKALSSPALPSWGVVELLVETMGGDRDRFHDLWLAASVPPGRPGHADHSDRAGRAGRAGQGLAPGHRLAGRHTELTVVRRHLETGHGLLLITGEAGIGKSRLVQVASEGAACVVLTATAHPSTQGEPFALLTDVLRQALELDDGSWFKEAQADCPAYVELSIARILPELEGKGARDADDQFAVARLLAAIRALLTALGALRPLALVTEDLHWADPTSLDFLDRHLGGDAHVPVVATARTDDPDADDVRDWLVRARSSAVQVLELAPLTRAETAEQMRIVTGQAPTESDVDRVHRLAGGLPLFVAELATWGEGEELPHRLVDSFETQLRRLPDAAREVVSVTAVAGRPLPARLVGEVTGLDRPGLNEALRVLERRRMLRRPYAADVGLHHPLLGEAARALLVPGEEPYLHGRLAASLAASEAPSPAEVAAHWQQAGRTAEEFEWRLRAARLAARRLATVEECEHWMRLLDLWHLQPPQQEVLSRGELLSESLGALMHTGREDEVRPLIDEILALAPTLPPRTRAMAMRRASQALLTSHPSTAVALAENARRGYEALGDLTGVVESLCDQARALRGQGHFDEAGDIARRALALGRDMPDAARLRDLMIEKAWHDVAAGRRAEGLATLGEALAIEVSGNPFSDVWLSQYHTDLLLMLSAPASEVEQAASPGLAAARPGGVESWVSSTMVVCNVVEARLVEGLVAAAGDLVDPVTAGEPQHVTRFLHVQRARVDLARGRPADAVRRLAELERFEFAGVVGGEVLPAARAACDLWCGRPEAAWQRLERTFGAPRRTGWSPYTGHTLVLAARAAADLAASGAGDPAVLRRRLDDLLGTLSDDPFGPRVPVAAAPAATRLWEAEVARLDGTDTITHWHRAATAADAVRRGPDAAYARWRGARAALREGEGTVAARLLRRAARDAREHVPLSRAIAATPGVRP